MKKLLLLTIMLFANNAHAAGVEISNAWARTTIANQTVGAVYLTVANKTDETITLTGAKTVFANRVDMHQTAVDVNGVMAMNHVSGIEIQPNGVVVFEPNGLHFMLMGLQQPLKVGMEVPFTLMFNNGKEYSTGVKIEGLSYNPKK